MKLSFTPIEKNARLFVSALLLIMVSLSVNAQLRLSADCSSGTADLSVISAANIPAGTSLSWHFGTPASSANKLTAIDAVVPGTYYAAFYDADNNCYSASATSVIITAPFCIENVCPAPLANLSTALSSSNIPQGAELSWHTGFPATNSNKVANPTEVGTGTYYAAFYDVVNNCYSGDGHAVAEVIVNIKTCSVALLPKVWLQGALFGVSAANGIMRDDLRSKNLLPLSSPYPAMSMPEVTPTSATTNAVLGVANPVENSIVDWVYVELRDGSNPTTTLNTTSALIQRDGDIVGVDGVSPVTFSQIAAGNYYVVIRHRNHLGVMSVSPIALSSVPAVVDFRDGSTVAYNLDDNNITNEPLVVVNQGLALWAGNALTDTRLIFQGNSNEVNVLFQSVKGNIGNVLDSPYYKLKAYDMGDLNMNGETIFQGSGNDIEFLYLNIIQNHLGNLLKQNNFFIRQQLP